MIKVLENLSITPSQFAKVMSLSTGQKGFGQTAMTYADECILKAIGVEMPDITNFAMSWGIKHEAEAIKRYEFEALVNVVPTDRITSKEFSYVNGLPDGLIPSLNAMIEVKCPYNPTNQFEVIRDVAECDQSTVFNGQRIVENFPKGEYLATYWWQVQGYLWLTETDWCDFITYDRRFPNEMQMVVQRVMPNLDDIATLKRRIGEFHEIIKGRIPQAWVQE
jgi:hypothetical protein